MTNAKLILQDKVIRTSTARIPRFGTGVFMTLLSPDKSDYELISNNYQGNYKYSSKVECAFAIEKSKISPCRIHDFKQITRDLWRNTFSINLNVTDFKLVIRTHSY